MLYHILTAYDSTVSRYVMLFGDYDQEVVAAEMDDQQDSDYDEEFSDWCMYTCGDTDSEILAFVSGLNPEATE